MKHLIANTIIAHIILAYLGRFITLYFPMLSENPIVEVLSMNQRKIVTTSVLVTLTVALAQYMIQQNIKIKSL